MAEEEVESIVVEREALMVPSQVGSARPVSRTAHFLKPVFSGRSPPPVSPSLPGDFDPSKCPLKVNFCSWKKMSAEWKRWAAEMELKHGETWKGAGILEAVRASTHETLAKDPALLLSLAQRWSPETRTFVFRWGEATVTLEDVAAIGAYPALGSSVVARLETEEMNEAERKLQQAWYHVRRATSWHRVPPGAWLRKFMGSGSEIEHEAFLAQWLSQFVLPRSDSVAVETFHVAIRLARGKRVALAAAVLAAIYRDLSLLKKGIDRFSPGTGNRGKDDVTGASKLNIWALFQLVQVWVWERFPTVRPNPNPIRGREPRVARWVKTRKPPKLPNLGMAFDSDIFRWRPYARPSENPEMHMFYPENDMWVMVDSSTDDELLSFARFLIPCELIGMDDCVEQYHPYRVGMQFGMDQDLPSVVAWSQLIGKISWTTYGRPITTMKVYIPSRVSEAGVTTRYSKWWEGSKVTSGPHVEIKDAGQFKLKSKAPMSTDVQKKMEGMVLSAPPGFKQKRDEVGVQALDDSSYPKDSKVRSGPHVEIKDAGQFKIKSEPSMSTDVLMKMEGMVLSAPPGFEKKWDEVGVRALDGSSHPEDSKVSKTNVRVEMNVLPTSVWKQSKSDILNSGDFPKPKPKSSSVLTSPVRNKTEKAGLSVRPGLQHNESDDSSDEDRLTIEQFLRRKKSGGTGNSTVGESMGPSTPQVVSSTSDNSPLLTGKSPVVNAQGIVEDEANTEERKRKEDMVGMPSRRGASAAENTGRSVAEMTISNLEDRLSKAEEFLAKYLRK